MENNQTKNDRQLRHRETTYKSRLSFVDPLESKKLRVSIVPLVTKKFSMNDGTTMLEDQALGSIHIHVITNPTLTVSSNRVYKLLGYASGSGVVRIETHMYSS